jgi:hypothetical protein
MSATLAAVLVAAYCPSSTAFSPGAALRLPLSARGNAVASFTGGITAGRSHQQLLRPMPLASPLRPGRASPMSLSMADAKVCHSPQSSSSKCLVPALRSSWHSDFPRSGCALENPSWNIRLARKTIPPVQACRIPRFRSPPKAHFGSPHAVAGVRGIPLTPCPSIDTAGGPQSGHPYCSHFLPRGATFGPKVLTCPIPGERNGMRIHDGGRHQGCLRLYPGIEPHGDPPTLLPPSAATSLQQCRKELKFGPTPRLGADRLPPRARPDPLRFQGWQTSSLLPRSITYAPTIHTPIRASPPPPPLPNPPFPTTLPSHHPRHPIPLSPSHHNLSRKASTLKPRRVLIAFDLPLVPLCSLMRSSPGASATIMATLSPTTTAAATGHITSTIALKTPR